MAKGERSTRAVRTKENTALEHKETYDDNALPLAEEIERYKQIDPSFIPFIQEYIKNEQIARRENREAFTSLENRKLDLANDTNRKLFRLDLTTLILAATIVLGGMAVSAVLICVGQVLTGTIFSGLTLVYAANSFLNFRKVKSNHPKPKGGQ